MTSERHEEIEHIIKKKLNRADIGAKSWSTLYNGSLIVSALASAIAAIFLKLDITAHLPYRTDISAILAGVAAVLTTIAAAGGFDRKWQINRISRSRLEQLQVDLTNPQVNEEEIREELKQIIEQHEEGILGPKKKAGNS